MQLPQNGKWDSGSITLLFLHCQKLSESAVVTLTFVRHASNSSKNRWCKRAPFNLKNSRRVKALFIIIVKLLNLLRGEILEWIYVRVAYPSHQRTQTVLSPRTGSISTSVHTACRISTSRSRISLCRCIMYPPRIQIKAWSASNTSSRRRTPLRFHWIPNHIST